MHKTTLLTVLALSTLAAAPSPAGDGDAMNPTIQVIDFSDPGDREWMVVNDGVMGGLSRSGIRRTDRGTGVFSGELSLENNGGFASVRLAVGRLDLSAHAGLEMRVRGDGRTYQLRLRTDDGFDGLAYRTVFATRDGEWLTIRRRFTEFEPTFRGRTPRGAGPLDPARIRQVGFLIADQQPGSFSLEIDFVRTWADVSEEK